MSKRSKKPKALKSAQMPVYGTNVLVFEHPLFEGAYAFAPANTGILTGFVTKEVAKDASQNYFEQQIIYAYLHLSALEDIKPCWFQTSTGVSAYVGVWQVAVWREGENYVGKVHGFNISATAATEDECKAAILAAFLEHIKKESDEASKEKEGEHE